MPLLLILIYPTLSPINSSPLAIIIPTALYTPTRQEHSRTRHLRISRYNPSYPRQLCGPETALYIYKKLGFISAHSPRNSSIIILHAGLFHPISTISAAGSLCPAGLPQVKVPDPVGGEQTAKEDAWIGRNWKICSHSEKPVQTSPKKEREEGELRPRQKVQLPLSTLF